MTQFNSAVAAATPSLRSINSTQTEELELAIYLTNMNHVPKDVIWIEPDACPEYDDNGRIAHIWQMIDPKRGERAERQKAIDAGYAELAKIGRLRQNNSDTGEYVFPDYAPKGAPDVWLKDLRKGLAANGLELFVAFCQPRYDQSKDVPDKNPWKYRITLYFLPKTATEERKAEILNELGVNEIPEKLRDRSVRALDLLVQRVVYRVHVYNNPIIRKVDGEFRMIRDRWKFTVNCVIYQDLFDKLDSTLPAKRPVTDASGKPIKGKMEEVAPRFMLVVRDHELQLVEA
jgi:hypothetical protein